MEVGHIGGDAPGGAWHGKVDELDSGLKDHCGSQRNRHGDGSHERCGTGEQERLADDEPGEHQDPRGALYRFPGALEIDAGKLLNHEVDGENDQARGDEAGDADATQLDRLWLFDAGDGHYLVLDPLHQLLRLVRRFPRRAADRRQLQIVHDLGERLVAETLRCSPDGAFCAHHHCQRHEQFGHVGADGGRRRSERTCLKPRQDDTGSIQIYMLRVERSVGHAGPVEEGNLLPEGHQRLV